MRNAVLLTILPLLFLACSARKSEPVPAKQESSVEVPAEDAMDEVPEGIPKRPDPLPAPDCNEPADCLAKAQTHKMSDAVGAMAQALADYEKACAEDSAEACLEAGLVYWLWDQPGDGELALKRLNRSCELGLASGCTKAGTMLELGWATGKPDVDGALAFYEKGCAGEDPLACERVTEIRTLLDAPVGLHPDLQDKPPEAPKGETSEAPKT